MWFHSMLFALYLLNVEASVSEELTGRMKYKLGVEGTRDFINIKIYLMLLKRKFPFS
jgi:hypothetical protein